MRNAGSADAILRSACKKLEIEGVSTHSFRRTALTRMSDAGVPLRHIQAISGHKTLSALERYLGVTEQQKETAISTLDFFKSQLISCHLVKAELTIISLITVVTLAGVEKSEFIPVPVRVNETKNRERKYLRR